MTIEKYKKQWRDVLAGLEKDSGCAAYGWFDKDGNLLAGNRTLWVFLGSTPEECKPVYYFVNPDFDKLSRLDSGQALIFEGLLTIGNFKDISFVLKSKIYKRDEMFFVFAEADILNLFEENKKMSRLNQEVNNLQRQLMKEKAILENTLNELRETQQMLIHSEKMNALGQMVAGVAHEINNPIAFVTNNLFELEKYSGEYIKAFNELAAVLNASSDQVSNSMVAKISEKYELELLTEDINEVLKDSKAGVKRVKNIVEDLRRFSRLDESDIKHIDLIENMKSTISIAQSEINKKSIHFTLHAPDKMMLNCFPGQLNQAILNILLNALQAVSDKGEVSLSMNEQPVHIEIIISDNGIGIEAGNLDKIFNPFFTTKPVGSGTGLGLSIAHKIIKELHQGKIEVESEKGNGTKFLILLPKKLKE